MIIFTEEKIKKRGRVYQILAALATANLATLLFLLAVIRLLLKTLFAITALASALFASFRLLTATAKARLLALPPPDELREPPFLREPAFLREPPRLREPAFLREPPRLLLDAMIGASYANDKNSICVE